MIFPPGLIQPKRRETLVAPVSARHHDARLLFIEGLFSCGPVSALTVQGQCGGELGERPCRGSLAIH